METSTNGTRIKIIDSFVFVIEEIYSYIYFILASNQLTKNFVENYQLRDFLNTLNDNLRDHPFVKIAIFGALACFLFPIIFFILFAIVTILLTFTGFVVIEGFILAVGGFCLCICLVSMVMVMAVMGISLLMVNSIAKKLEIL